MRRASTILVVPLLLLAAFFAVEQTIRVKGALAVSPPPVTVHGPAAAPRGASVAEPTRPTEEEGPAPAAPTRKKDRRLAAAERARVLLDLLRSWAVTDTQTFPSPEIEEVGDLLTRHPELAEVFLKALEAEDGIRLRTYLLFAFHKVGDATLKAELLAAHRKTDRRRGRLTEILADRSLVLATLRETPDAQLSADLVNRMGEGLVQDAEVIAELLRMAVDEQDDLTRRRAISRLGSVDRPEARELLLEILGDPTRALGDRDSAAQQLKRTPCERAVLSFIAIIDEGEGVSLQRFAALGLRHSGANPEARRVLLDLLRDGKGDEQARRNSATALASCLGALEGADRRELGVVLRGALDELAREEHSRTVAVHSMIVLSHALGTDYHAELREFFNQRASIELRQMMLAHPALKRVLEM